MASAKSSSLYFALLFDIFFLLMPWADFVDGPHLGSGSFVGGLFLRTLSLFVPCEKEGFEIHVAHLHESIRSHYYPYFCHSAGLDKVPTCFLENQRPRCYKKSHSLMKRRNCHLLRCSWVTTKARPPLSWDCPDCFPMPNCMLDVLVAVVWTALASAPLPPMTLPQHPVVLCNGHPQS